MLTNRGKKGLCVLAAALLFIACQSGDKKQEEGDGKDKKGAEDAGKTAKCEDVECAKGEVCSEKDGLCHCGSEGGAVCEAYEACKEKTGECELKPSQCSAGTKWTAGTKAFREATEEWGLAEIVAKGIRINAVDFDGDGYPDLLVRFNGVFLDDLEKGEERRIWLLKNIDGKRFEDVTKSSELFQTRKSFSGYLTRPGEVYAFGDVNNDGNMDAYSGNYTADPDKALGETSEILLGKFGLFSLTDESNPIRRESEVDSPAGASFIDYDLDGNLDLWLPQNAYSSGVGVTFLQDKLFKGDGTGIFNDATEEAKLTTLDWFDYDSIGRGEAHSWAWSALACDLNNDGLPELMASSYGRSPNHLWQAKNEGGAVTFVNRSVASGYAYDENFEWRDNQFARCFCKDNPTAEECEGVPAPQVMCSANWNHASDRKPARLGGNSGTTVCADINNDGFMDLLTTEIKHWWAGEGSDHSEILLNTGENDVRFTRPGRETTGIIIEHDMKYGGWDEGHMTAAVFDFDNDGWPDIYIGASDYPLNRGLLFHQKEPLKFQEVMPEDFFEHNRSHGVAIADFDGDGDLDIVVGHSFARCDANAPNNCYETQQVRLFENIIGDKGNWIQLKLEGGKGANRSAIGARVTVATKETTQTQQVGGGHGHFGTQNDLVLHFGLGGECEAEVTINWPNAERTVQTFKAVSGYRYFARIGEKPELIVK